MSGFCKEPFDCYRAIRLRLTYRHTPFIEVINGKIGVFENEEQTMAGLR